MIRMSRRIRNGCQVSFAVQVSNLATRDDLSEETEFSPFINRVDPIDVSEGTRQTPQSHRVGLIPYFKWSSARPNRHGAIRHRVVVRTQTVVEQIDLPR